MTESEPGDRALDRLAERAIEVLVTHNEPVTRDDLACALRVSGAEAWDVATALEKLGYARVDVSRGLIEATARASDPADAREAASPASMDGV